MRSETYHRLAEAFYRRVETDAILRPLYPRSLGCATRSLGTFLADIATGDGQYPAHFRRPRLRSLHARFGIDSAKRDAWLRIMADSLEEIEVEEPFRSELFAALTEAASFLAGTTEHVPVAASPTNPISTRFRDMILVDEVLDAVDSRDSDRICRSAGCDVVALVESGTDGPAMQAIAAFGTSGIGDLYGMAESRIRSDPTVVNQRFGGDQTLLHRAAIACCVPFARLLLELGADPNVVDAAGHPALYYAANRMESGLAGGNPQAGADLVSLFAANGANLDLAEGVKRCTPLHMAARRGNSAIAASLVRHGADIEAHDSNGETPLRRAVNCGKVETARVLIELGANPFSRDNRGKTPRDSARSSEMRDILAGRREGPND